jgi:hypothetical protein
MLGTTTAAATQTLHLAAVLLDDTTPLLTNQELFRLG